MVKTNEGMLSTHQRKSARGEDTSNRRKANSQRQQAGNRDSPTKTGLTGNKNSEGQIIESLVEANPFKNTGIKGPKIDYYNIGKVGWQGLNGLVEYNKTNLSAVLQAGLSNQSFQRIDYFDQPANPTSEKKNVGGDC